MCVYWKHGGQRGHKGQVVNLPQDIQGFLNRLPCNFSNLPILLVCRHGAENTYRDFRVRRERILLALQWLNVNNPCYKDIMNNPCCKDFMIDHVALQLLPEDGIPPELLTVDEDEECRAQSVSREEDDEHDSSSFLPLPTSQTSEDDAICSALNTHLE